MIKASDVFQLLRVKQWYKNLLVYLALFFSGNMFDAAMFYLTTKGFAALCLISSAGYILNDIIDCKADRFHPEKKQRPIASGKITHLGGYLIMILALIFYVYIVLDMEPYFVYSTAALFFLTMLYSFALKYEPFLDIVMIAVNFVIRAVSGAFAIGVYMSPWLILCPFFLSLFLSVGKRKADHMLLGKDAAKHKDVLRYYTKDVTEQLMIITTTSLIICYSLYSFLSEHNNLLFTLPVVIYGIFRYVFLINSGNEAARQPHKVFKDLRMGAAILSYAVMAAFIVYF